MPNRALATLRSGEQAMHGPELAFICERVGREVMLGDDEGQQRVANVLQPLVAARASVEQALRGRLEHAALVTRRVTCSSASCS